tara:strand:+ start:128 stop:487 length:360 start_codon:yes stop_codon:yes gene_type:complete
MKECVICYETKLEKFLPCGHSTCHDCFDKLNSNTCPYCRAPFREPTQAQINQEQYENDIEYWLDYDNRDWSVMSRYTRHGTEIIRVFRNGEVPQSWRNDPLTTMVKNRRFRRRRLRRRN